MSWRSSFSTAAIALVVASGAAATGIHATWTPPGQSPAWTGRTWTSTVSPCKDFYAYANGAFEKVPIPGEYAAYGVNQEIDERNFAILKEILENSARAGGPKGSVVQRVGDFYASGMDEAAIDREGLRPLAPWLGRIQAIASPKELMAVIAQLQVQGLNVGFHFDVEIDDKDTTAMIAGFSQGGLGLPERDYYFREGKDAEEIRAAYVAAHRPHARTGRRHAPAAKAAAASIMAFETKLAKASRTLVDLRDPEKNYNKFHGPRWASWPPASIGTAISPRSPFPAAKPSAGPPAGVLHGLRRPADLRAAGGLARLPALAPDLRNRRLSQQAFRGGAFLLLRQEALRRHGAAAALETRAGRGGCGHRRGFGPALRAEGVQPRRQGPGPDHGELSQGSHAGADPRRRRG